MTKNNFMNNSEYFDFDTFEERPMTDAEKRMQEVVDSIDFKTPKEGAIVNAILTGVTDKEILFDFGFKDYIRVDKKGKELDVLSNLESGESVNVAILGITESPEYSIKGSLSLIAEEEAKITMKNKMRSNTHTTAVVKKSIDAGYILDIKEGNATLTGFMPNTLAGANRIIDQESIVGETMEVMIESYDRNKGTYIVNRKRFLETLIKGKIKELEVGQTGNPYTGRVTGTTDYGVFVEFNGGLTGLIHAANIATESLNAIGISNVKEIPEGTEIVFYIKDILKNNRIILTQIFRESVWDTIKVGNKYSGTVKKVISYGVLVTLDDETQGLIHKSELSNINKDLKKGDTVDVEVVALFKSERKIRLKPC